ncbi:hypothetical protein [Rhizobium giardinii]|uniref:hypothetical protein n=1 Tax=Rhizobium giardinii TaxID=56731 RepID=UPI003D6F1031
MNKHNEFVPTAALAMITNINAVTGGNQFTDCGVGGSANQQIGMMRSDVPIQFGPDYKASVNLTFAVGTVFDGKEVIKQIGDVFSTVSSTLDTLEAFIKPYCA